MLITLENPTEIAQSIKSFVENDAALISIGEETVIDIKSLIPK